MTKYFVIFRLLHATFRIDRGSKLNSKSLKKALKCDFRINCLVMSPEMTIFAHANKRQETL